MLLRKDDQPGNLENYKILGMNKTMFFSVEICSKGIKLFFDFIL